MRKSQDLQTVNPKTIPHTFLAILFGNTIFLRLSFPRRRESSLIIRTWIPVITRG